jgi:hypothetical protein
MYKTPGLTCALLFVFAATASARNLTPTTFLASYRMMEETGEVVPIRSCAAASDLKIVDARTESADGRRFLEEKPDVEQPITMNGDIAAWVRSGVDALSRHALLRFGSTGKPTVDIRVESVWIEESVYRRAEFDGRVVLEVTVSPAQGGQPCWSERVDGFAENYGYAGKEENYQETINHALDRAILKAFSASGFADALCGCGATSKP